MINNLTPMASALPVAPTGTLAAATPVPTATNPLLNLNFSDYGVSDQQLQQLVQQLFATSPQNAQIFQSLQQQKLQIVQGYPTLPPDRQAEAVRLFERAKELQARILGIQKPPTQVVNIPQGVPTSPAQSTINPAQFAPLTTQQAPAQQQAAPAEEDNTPEKWKRHPHGGPPGLVKKQGAGPHGGVPPGHAKGKGGPGKK